MRKNGIRLLVAGLCLGMTILTGCGGSGKEETAKENGDKKKVALVCDEAGTQVFILDMIAGLKASAEKYGFEAIIAECGDAAAYEDNCRAMVEEGVD